jgi:C1A family cysteine protease
MFGQNFAQTLQQMRIYIRKYGEKHSPYFKGMIWSDETANKITLSEVDLQPKNSNVFMSDLENNYQISLLKQTEFDAVNQEDIIKFFTALQQSTINLDNQGAKSQLHYCLYFPLYKPKLWEEVKVCVSILNAIQRPIEIDLFGFASDLDRILSADHTKTNILSAQKATNDAIKKIINFKEKQNNLVHFIVMQNQQAAGISLNLSAQTFTKIISEFAILCIECYDEMFGVVQSNPELQALGLSVLSLDKYYYVEYLLHKAYLFALEREGIYGVDKIEEVDINMATNKVQEILKNKIHILSEFFDNEIKTRLSNKTEQEIIVQELTPVLKKKTEQIASECEEFITDIKLSIPAKRAIFSALLGEDDELFENQIFTEEPVILDDIDTEAMQVYIDANNALLNTEKQKEEAILSENQEPVISPLNEIKKLRTEIIRETGYIRKLEQDVDELSNQVDNIEESKKSLTDDGFYEFGGINYQLLPKIDEKPLEENYVPHEVKSAVVDLRNGFTSIKNQGQIGACTAFSLVSIYEYILKSNKQKDFDLSEAFVYYNARKKSADENKLAGSRIDYAIESLVEYGVCLEEKWTNKNGSEDEIREFYTTEPNQEAKNDALLRRVKKAVNVKLTLKDIKSALEDGYPVEISITIFGSFGKNSSGVISYPTAEEIETAKNDNINRRHAMVICGYSDEEKLFVVRNSWGTEFGDKGYCYMPYSYIINEDLTGYAVAIIEVATFTAKGIVKRTSLPFGEDVKMRYAIKKNILEEERRILSLIKNVYSNLKLQYNVLHEAIFNPHNQKNLTESTKIRLTKEKKILADEYNMACNKMDEKLDAFDANTRSKAISLSLRFGVIIILELLYCYIYKRGYYTDWTEKIFSEVGLWLIVWSLIFGVAVVGGYVLFRILKRKRLKNELPENAETQDYLSAFNKKTRRRSFNIFLLFSMIGILGGISGHFYNNGNHDKWWNFWTNIFHWLYDKSLLVSILLLVTGIITVGVFILLRIKKREQLKNTLQGICNDWNTKVATKEKELKENKLRMHFAGMTISENSKTEHNLYKKYQFMQSFFVNLNTWHTMENSSLKTMDDQIPAPFISVINNDTLDGYFEQQRDELTKNISFCNIFVNKYQLSEDGISAFQAAIKQTFCEELLVSIKDFTLYDCLVKPDTKSFLVNKTLKELLPDLEDKSDVFVQHSKSPNASKNIFIFTRDEDEKHNWQNISRPHFSCRPYHNAIISPLKLIMVQMEEMNIENLYL